ncbi:AraC family transcriptional regulator [Aliagarivorans marinus]|uniref:AraC family transcriptional regulator n=1 Tax=Aliagarivorans marinus TaxID=561965 RepID=UPI00042150FF|nr:AraC family transcriptional regulator [Aliagarivorans marinus]
MPQNQRYLMDLTWPMLVRRFGFELRDILIEADLDPDLYDAPHPSLNADEYFRFWEAFVRLGGGEPFCIELAELIRPETFSPPLHAVFCSEDLNRGFARLAEYKILVGPMLLDVSVNKYTTTLSLKKLPLLDSPPKALLAVELVMMTELVRQATCQRVVPLKATLPFTLNQPELFEAYLGTKVELANGYSLMFSSFDASQPFVSANRSLLALLEPELRKRLSQQQLGSIRKRVSEQLLELLPSGDYSIDKVAKQLAMSKRSLQRQLTEEDTSFQQEVKRVRQQLAKEYLADPQLSRCQIAFLLGYRSTRSFARMFAELETSA